MIEQGFTPLSSTDQSRDAQPTVLLVEDDTLVAMVVEEGLRDLGFEPHTVINAAGAAAAMAAGLNPALAIIDVGLPDERGDVLAGRLRGLYPTLRMIIASGYDEMELKARFSGDALVTVLGKPYTESDLAGAVSRFDLES